MASFPLSSRFHPSLSTDIYENNVFLLYDVYIFVPRAWYALRKYICRFSVLATSQTQGGDVALWELTVAGDDVIYCIAHRNIPSWKSRSSDKLLYTKLLFRHNDYTPLSATLVYRKDELHLNRKRKLLGASQTICNASDVDTSMNNCCCFLMRRDCIIAF